MPRHDQIVHFSFPTAISFGPGARKLAPEIFRKANVKRPLLVTDSGIAQLPFCRELSEEFRRGGLELLIFSDFQGNPIERHVQKGTSLFQKQGADGILALGGGAATDVAKAIALMVHHPGTLFDYEESNRNIRPIDQPIPFFAAIPTTAGTGSEVGRSAVISDNQTKQKNIIFSERLLPQRVLADPELTLDLPPKITATTGMDAVTHLIEAYLAKGFHPICDGIALEGLRLAAENLAPAVRFAQAKKDRSPEHLRVRGAMMNAAMMGAVAFQKGLGAVHSCAHALATVCDLHHGLANGMMLPHVMRFNLPDDAHHFDRMAQVVGAKKPTGQAFLVWIDNLTQAIGIPSDLSSVGVTKADLDRLAEVAVKDACHQLNPRPVTREDFHALFSGALGE